MIAKTPQPPYYAVIFTSVRTDNKDGYADTAAKMIALAAEQPGFLGVESAREKLGITVSYWESLEAIQHWKQHTEHAIAREKGKKDWYQSFTTRIALVEKSYSFTK